MSELEVNMSELSPLELLHGQHPEPEVQASTNADPMDLLSAAERQSIAAAQVAKLLDHRVTIDTSVPPAETPYRAVDYVGPPVGADNAAL